MTERWGHALRLFGERPNVDAFLAEIDAVCRRHGMSIGHEDGHGAFEVEEYSSENAEWLGAANDALPSSRAYGPPPPPSPRRATIDGQRALLYWDTFAWVAQGVAVDVVGQGDTEREAVESFQRSLGDEWRMRPAPPRMPELLAALWDGLPEWPAP